MTKPTRYSVGAALVRADRVLIQQRSATDNYPNKWEFPGGKVETETPIEAMVRELIEELEIEAEEKDLELVGVFTHELTEFILVSHFYICRKWKGEPSPIDGQQDVKWVRANELESYDLLLKTRDAIPYLLKLI